MIHNIKDYRLKDVFRIVSLAVRFQKVKRVLYAPLEDRAEGDAEHSYQLALLAWFLVRKMRLKYDLFKVVGYSLLHDLPEVYANDTDIYNLDQIATKRKREKKACQLLKREFPDFPEMHLFLEEYENNATEEACFVRALDKLVASVGIAIDNGRSWHERETSFWKLAETQRPKAACHPKVLKLFDKLLRFLKDHEGHFFPRGENRTFSFANGHHRPFVVKTKGD